MNGVGNGTNAFFVAKNNGDTNDDSITFSAVDGSGNVRLVKWKEVAPARSWLKMRLVSSGSGDGTLKLYVNNVEATITSQTNDGGFSISEVFEVLLGSDNLAAALTEVTGLYFYDRDVTEAEGLIAYEQEIYPSDHITAFPLTFPNRGLAEELPTNS